MFLGGREGTLSVTCGTPSYTATTATFFTITTSSTPTYSSTLRKFLQKHLFNVLITCQRNHTRRIKTAPFF